MMKQKNIGSHNKNISIKITINGKDNIISILQVLEEVGKIFESQDEEINNSLPNRVLINKTNKEELYQTSKIISSLLQLGVPLTATYEIACSTIDKIWDYIEKKNTGVLSTKDIRKMVSLSIQEMDINRFSYSDIQKWTNRYVRRYGHNNHVVEIYNKDSGEIIPVSYEYICNKLLEDVIGDIAPEISIKEDIKQHYKKEIATEILDFINSCDLYQIEYNLLKNMIIEIALQPPHPWFVTSSTRSTIIEYDKKCLCNNMAKVEKAIKEKSTVPQSAKLEILHHASAIILESHNYFLGCYDLSAFYLLREIVKNALNPDYWDLAINYSDVSNLLSNFAFAGLDIKKLSLIIEKINNYLPKGKIDSADFDETILEFAKYALQLQEYGGECEVKDLLNSNWEKSEEQLIIKKIKLLLYSIYPSKRFNADVTSNNFWINYILVKSKIHGTMKNQILVIFASETNNDTSCFNRLKDSRIKSLCNTILIVGDSEKKCLHLQKELQEYMDCNNLTEFYVSFYLDKCSLCKLAMSTDKVQTFDEILEEQMIIE